MHANFTNLSSRSNFSHFITSLFLISYFLFLIPYFLFLISYLIKASRKRLQTSKHIHSNFRNLFSRSNFSYFITFLFLIPYFLFLISYLMIASHKRLQTSQTHPPKLQKSILKIKFFILHNFLIPYFL